ncbi:fused MFS/spermidine synthase [Actinosynnema sp. NPDC020468]|uniref:spermidine synthase n=1 Tax=Actinosynnema sp. NPDC020468 TaxID=3154488 RepID=UPI003410496F
MTTDRREVPRRRVRFGEAELLPDPFAPRGWTLAVDGVFQSYVDLADPTHLRMPYVTWMAAVIDQTLPTGLPVRAVHVGGGGLALPRYVSTTRPGSEQVVFDLDGPLVEFVLTHLPTDVPVRIEDGAEGIRTLPRATADLVVLDVFRAGEIAAELATVEFFAEAAEVLTPKGVLTTNLHDGQDLTFTRRAATAAAEVLPHVAAISTATVFLRESSGSVVVVASRSPLPLKALDEWSTTVHPRPYVVTSAQITALYGAIAPSTTTARSHPTIGVRKAAIRSDFEASDNRSS